MTRITRYPAALDDQTNLPDIDQLDKMDDEGIEHDIQHTLLNQAVIELQKKVGVDDSQDDASHEARIKDLEENGGGGGGAGLELGDPETPSTGGNIEAPDKPAAWLVATIGGVDYLIPAFLTKELLAPTNLDAANAKLFYPTRFKAHHYIPVDEE